MTTVERYDEVLPGVDYTQTPLPVAAEIAELNLRFIRNEQDEIQFCNDPGQYQTIKNEGRMVDCSGPARSGHQKSFHAIDSFGISIQGNPEARYAGN
jgi:hypothetical protein